MGLDSFTKNVSLEQKEIRSIRKDDFLLVHLFQEAYEKGELQTAGETTSLHLDRAADS
ncbi:hypothetical protein ACT6P6_12335 [Priestia endophytica]|uniref:hypothetical protein n=1 Tax=Priestia filamentosa TaxID=1402861 RepID=UPI002E1AEEBF|nr:hypothetical protein [Priestia filamentosa]